MNTAKISLLDFHPTDLRALFKKNQVEAYRADQILDWVYQKGVYDFNAMRNLSPQLRKELDEHFEVPMPEAQEVQASDEDFSRKFLFKLASGDFVETVLMPIKNRVTVCVSSQVGCKFHCAFCASGQDGFFRNLTAAEIIGQVLKARDQAPGKKITNIVFMGIGEPLDNYDELLKAIRILNSDKGLHIGARKITISTCGVIPKIEALIKEELQVELSVSLHGASDAVREAIMPVNRAFPVEELIRTCKRYMAATKRAVTFEYILISGVNASEKDAEELGELLAESLCKVNLIPYNPIAEFPHEAPAYQDIVRFQKIVQGYGIRATVRFSKGKDIQAACGQLRSVKLKRK